MADCRGDVFFWFQSTHSLRSATHHRVALRKMRHVSIHALLAECDAKPYQHSFLRHVSIHALLAECDNNRHERRALLVSFNPRTPCGVRPFDEHNLSLFLMFQSTHSLRSATISPKNKQHFYDVSIHALLSECDALRFDSLRPLKRFNPRTPCGVRPWNFSRQWPGCRVSIHALLAECDSMHSAPTLQPCWFQSTHSLRSATAPDLIHCYSTEQIILCANLPKKTVIARLLFLSIYLSIFYSQCITPIADLPGNSCELEVGAQAMFNSL